MRSRIGEKLCTTSLLLALIIVPSAGALAQIMAVQTYYVPLPEDQVRETLAALNPGATSFSIESVVSIAIALDDTVIVYDHFEDGYGPGGTTEIWGDGNAGNGAPPGFPGDVLTSGDVIVLENTVALTDPGGAVIETDPPQFNGRDKFETTQPVAVTRVAWAPTPGTVLAGAVEVFPTSEWGDEYEAPIGENIPSSEMFELVTGSYMASENDTVLDVDLDNDSIIDFTTTLDEGESFLIPLAAPVPAGARATTSAAVQLHAMTGDLPTGIAAATWESRWAVVLPLDLWSTEYFVPVSTRLSSTEDPTDVFVYNPDPVNPITVNWETTAASGGVQTPIIVGPRGVERVTMPNGPSANDTGARFFSDSNFYAVAAVDANDPNNDSNISDLNNRDYDWGLALVPTAELSTQALVGFAPSIDPTSAFCVDDSPFICNPPSGDGSPVWVMAADTAGGMTEVFVDFDGDNMGPLMDIFGNNYDELLTLNPLERARVFDLADNDNTGTLLYTLDGTRLAVAWGQDPDNSVRTNPYFDAGTYVPALPQFTMLKEVDQALVEPGAKLTYTILITNTSRGDVLDVMLQDDLPPNYVTYVADSTFVDGAPLGQPDGGEFPLSSPVNLGDLEPGMSFEVTFMVTVDDFDDVPPIQIGDDPEDVCLPGDPEPDPQTALINNATVTAGGFTEEDDALTCVEFPPEIDIEKATNGQDADDPDGNDVPRIVPGDAVTWTYVVTNVGDVSVPIADITVTDNIPGVTPVFVSESGPADGILSPGEQATYEAEGTALDLETAMGDNLVADSCNGVEEPPVPRTAYTNLGTVFLDGEPAAEDPSSYCNPPDEPPSGITRTLGYWKNHPTVIDGSFDGPDGFPSLLPLSFCGEAIVEPCDAVAFLESKGGGINNFKRQGMAALLNCQAFGCSGEISDLIQDGSEACANGDAFDFGGAGETLDFFNNSGDDLELPFQSPSAQPKFCK